MEPSLLGFLKWFTGTLLACISFAGWILGLVNVSLLHDDCGSETVCDNFFRRYWWSLMFQVGVMVVVFALWVMGTAHKARAAVVGFLTLVTVQHIELTGKLLTALDDKADFPKYNARRGDIQWVEQEVLKGAVSGFAVLVFANMAYMIIFGADLDAIGHRGTIPAETPKKKEEAPTEQTPPV